MFGNKVKIPIDFSTKFLLSYFLGPTFSLYLSFPRMIATDGGKSALLIRNILPTTTTAPTTTVFSERESETLLGYNHPTLVYKLICENEDPSQCKWNQLDYDLPFEVIAPVAMLIPDEIVPSNCN